MKAIHMIAAGSPGEALQLVDVPEPEITTPTSIKVQLRAAGVNLREQYDVSLDDVLADFRLFGAYQEKSLP